MRANLCCYVCQNMRNMTFCSATNDQHQPIHPLTYAEIYAASRTHLNQLPEPTNLHRCACQGIRNTTDTPQTTTLTGRPAPSRVSGHTLRDRYPTVSNHRQTSLQLVHAGTYATTRNHTTGGGTDTGIHASTGTTASLKGTDKRDRSLRPRIRRRITARVWRAAAPRRPRSSSTRAG